jgi:hypothetical protein
MTTTEEQEDRLLKLISKCWNQPVSYKIDLHIINNADENTIMAYDRHNIIRGMKIEPGISIRIEDNVLYVTIDK